jgi:oligopeptide/dipeptide ABC transporter ATP-binding protein
MVIADEPVSALDVSMQAQIINLLADVREAEGLALLLIAHDLAVVRQLADEIAVFHLGQVVEIGDAEQVLGTASHPYTRALISAVPVPDVAVERRRERIVLRGDLPSPIDPPPGCRFHTRCPLAVERCRVEEPVLRPVRSGARAACHLAESHA